MMINDIQSFSSKEIKKEISSSEKRLHDVVTLLKKAETEFNSSSSSSLTSEVNSPNANNDYEWSLSYKRWDYWNKVESLTDQVQSEEKKLENLQIKSETSFTHLHDHSEERKIFELPEEEKIKLCEKYRAKGNYLFYEGVYSKAAEHYQIALSYYEYCFPESELAQKELDDLRVICLCNLAQSYSKIGYKRYAVEKASLVLTIQPSHYKALFIRAKAYRNLDEYDKAFNDLEKASTIKPNDPAILSEIKYLKSLSAKSLAKEKLMASNIIYFSKKNDTIYKHEDHSLEKKSLNDIKFVFQDINLV